MGGVHGNLCGLRWWQQQPSTRDLDHENLQATIPSHGLVLRYASLTQSGYYPGSPDRENQDSLRISTNLQGNPNLHFFGVFDGHGQFGAACSNFVKERLVEVLAGTSELTSDPVGSYAAAFRATNAELHESEIDDTLSGSTAVTVLVSGDALHVANVGDSRAVLGVWDGRSVVAADLSRDQTPFREDEYERVKREGARVMSVGQMSGVKDPEVQVWGEGDREDPPRLWVENGEYPGTAFTRSVGDSVAEGIGAVADPEVTSVTITPDHLFFVLASDGVFDFLSSQDVISLVCSYDDLRDACAAVVEESYKRWQEEDCRVDDITVIVVRLEDKRSSNSVGNSGSYTDTLKKVFGFLRRGILQ